MSDVTMEQKMQLVQQIRSRYNEDQYDMYNRERILYGNVTPNRRDCFADSGQEEYSAPVSSFRFRLLLAVILFAGVIALDENKMNIGGITSEKILEAISVDYEEKIDEWVTALSQ